MSFDILKGSWCRHQKIVKAEKTKYLSDIILNNCHKPCVLFSTINAILNTPNLLVMMFPQKLVKNDSVDKIAIIRAQLEPVSPSLLKEIIGHMKSSDCPP